MTQLAAQIRQDAILAWKLLSQGWREISTRASGALTRFWPSEPSTKNSPHGAKGSGLRMASWAFLAADAIESIDKVIVRIEASGMQRDDFHVSLPAEVLCVWGEKRIKREVAQGPWRVMQNAYGNFRRDVLLPTSVKAELTRASYRDGVLRIDIPKSDDALPRRIAVQTA